MALYELDDMKGIVQEDPTTTHRGFNDIDILERHGFSEKSEIHRSQDEHVIARFGKRQQLKVGLHILNANFLYATAHRSSIYSLSNGGPAGLIIGFIAAWFGAMLQALVMAELASMIPLSGGPFNWVAILSPTWCRKFLSYMAGWLTIIAWQAFVAAVNFTCASLIQGLIILTRPDYDPQLWHATLLFYAVALFGLFVNTYLGRILPQIEALMLILFVMGFFGVLIPLAYLAPHKSAEEVFTVFQNFGGWSSMGLSFFVGWFTSVSSFVGSDGADHVAEEIQQATKVIPFSIWFSTFFNGALAFAMMITVLFSIGDLEKATNSETGFPFMDIFVGALGSVSAGSSLVILVTAINVFSISSVMATASRTLWAFSRENGLPYSKFIVKVNPKTRLPINAILVTLAVNLLLALISIGSTTAFEAFFSVVLAAYQSSFLIAASVMLHKRLTTPASDMPWGPFRLGRAGVPITITAIVYGIIAMFFSFWPSDVVVTAASMNYSVVIFGAALLFSLGFWFFHGRQVYVGPIWEFDSEIGRRDQVHVGNWSAGLHSGSQDRNKGR
ncbi:hypothetical protein MMC13_002695 [Lambiella insularis]|nr:hypothetical protein [Lambiella insularis]